MGVQMIPKLAHTMEITPMTIGQVDFFGGACYGSGGGVSPGGDICGGGDILSVIVFSFPINSRFPQWAYAHDNLGPLR